MDIRVLKYFVTVVEEENILKASQVLHITQPTLSRQLMERMRRSAIFLHAPIAKLL